MNEHEKWMVSEVPFTSRRRYIGPLIARFRAAFSQIATRWYVLPIVQQINTVFGQISRRFTDVADWVAGVDHDQATLTRTLAEARLQIARLEERVSLLEDRLNNQRQVDEEPGV